MNNKKKIIIICSMVVLLIAAGYLNILLTKKNNTTPVDGGKTTTVSFFAEQKTLRDTARAQTIQHLDAMIADEKTSDEGKESAETMKLDLISHIEMANKLESLIKAKGFDEAYVAISSDNVQVIVPENKDEKLTNEQTAQIFSIITSATDFETTNIVINPHTTT